MTQQTNNTVGDAYEAFDRFEKHVDRMCEDGNGMPDGFVEWWLAADLGQRSSFYLHLPELAAIPSA